MKTFLNNLISGAFSALLFSLTAFSGNAQEAVNEEKEVPTHTASQPSETAESWLAKMSHAMKSLNYSISLVLLKPGLDAQPYLWLHGVEESGVEVEQLNLLNGPGREVVRIGNKVSYFEPNVPPYSLSSTIINGPFPNDFLRNPEKLKDAYDFFMIGRSRIAGRAAQQIRVLSKDRTRYGLNLWLDQNTGLLLKLNMFSLDSQLLEQIQVTGLNVTTSPDEFFSKIEDSMLPEIVTYQSKKLRDSAWEINYLPVGMKVVKRDLHRLSGTGKTVEYIMLSDGLVDVSIYLQDFGNGQPIQNLVGTVQSDTLLTIQHGQLNITVIGKIPAETANRIANSIKRVN
ncbi:MucB/RseB C-terminal domain-containing protein [Paraglaciecola sp. 2405UD69-4]|uniref:MucB/RseB C-terminal domain-containing protein n=1 Tax=Paraglaciecola sp. 2405UD69-4 TaxID=3391836 RepID=UPI0039C9195A